MTPRKVHRLVAGSIGITLLLFLVSCDGGVEETGKVLVVEAFFDVGRGLPEVIVRHTAPLGGTYPTGSGLSDAEVRVTAGEEVLAYGAVPGKAGRYRAALPGMVQPGTDYRVEVRWEGEMASARTRTPPRLVIDSLRTFPFSAPVRAILLDSLRFDTLGTGAREGYVYPVEVVAWWSAVEPEGDTLWLRSRLQSAQPFQSSVVDLFFPPERVVEEHTLRADGAGQRAWRGLYAVPVERADSPLPRHRLRAALVRGGRDYARFAATRNTPGRREPIGNVAGGLGIVAGVSVDSLTLEVGW